MTKSITSYINDSGSGGSGVVIIRAKFIHPLNTIIPNFIFNNDYYIPITSTTNITVNKRTKCDILIIGGGGGGGGSLGGGGGGGGVVYIKDAEIKPDTYTITVGSGGLPANNGGNTTAFGCIGYGGGAGGHEWTISNTKDPGNAGGSGGS